MKNMYCTKCGKVLDTEDKLSGKCHACGQSIKDDVQDKVKLFDLYLHNYGNDKNKCVALISETLAIDTASAEKSLESMPVLLLKDGTEKQMKDLSLKCAELQAKTVIKAHTGEQSQNNDTSNIEYIEPKKKKKSNKTADTIEIIGGFIIALGIICSIALGVNINSFWAFIGSLAVFFIIGMSFIGQAEIIQLLDDIKNK